MAMLTNLNLKKNGVFDESLSVLCYMIKAIYSLDLNDYTTIKEF
jgi:hypothetical protein